MSGATDNAPYPRWPIASVLAIAVGARLVAAFVIGGEFGFADEIQYADAADRLLAGDGFHPRYPGVPAYPVILAALSPFGVDVIVLRLAQAAITGLAGLALFAFANRFAGYWPALGATLLYALDPLMVVTSALLYPETLAAVSMIIVCYASWLARETGKLGPAVVAGVALGVLCMLRPVALLLIPTVAVWLPLASPSRRGRLATGGCVLIAAALFTLTPWTVRNFQVHGRLVAISTAGVEQSAIARDAVEGDSRGFAASILAKIAGDPLAFAERTAKQLGHFWELYPTRLLSDEQQSREKMHRSEPRLPAELAFQPSLRNTVSVLSSSIEYLLALIGLFLCWRDHKRETLFIVLVVFVYAMGYAPFYAKLRYRITVLPLVYVLAGFALAAIGQRIAGMRSRESPDPVPEPSHAPADGRGRMIES